MHLWNDYIQEEEHRNRNDRVTLWQLLRQVSVEPTMFLYMMAFMLTTVVEQVFFVYKACRVDHGYPEDVCRNIEKFENVKKEVQVCYRLLP